MKSPQAKVLSSKQKTNKILAILTLISLAIAVAIIGQLIIVDHNTNQIVPDGTIINGINVSGMTKKEAGLILGNKFEEKADKFKLTINSDDKSWTFDKSDFEVNSDIHTVLDANKKTPRTTYSIQ